MNNFVADEIIRKIALEMQTGSDLVERLHEKGYNDIFESSNSLLKSLNDGYYYRIEDFIIDELYSLEHISDVLSGQCLFALRHRIEGLKGIFLGMLD